MLRLLITLVLVLFLCGTSASTVQPALISIFDVVVGNTSENFVSANFDYWPPGVDGWVPGSSVLNANLSDPRFIYLASQFAPAYWRIGGGPQDHVIYNITGEIPYSPSLCSWGSWMGTSCIINATRWDQINQFAEKVGWKLVFGLNALFGRANSSSAWNSSNAEMLFRYSVERNYSIYAFEFGNELLETFQVLPSVLGEDIFVVKSLIAKYWPNPNTRPKLFGPDSGTAGGELVEFWLPYLKIAGSQLDALTYHMYIGYGKDPNLVNELQTPDFLLTMFDWADLPRVLGQVYAPQAEIWAGETALAWAGGQNGTTNAFASTIWYAYQLGALASLNQKAFCRQTMLGGNYPLVNALDMQPNPDYYTAIIWKRLIGTEALYTSFDPLVPYIRGFAMCAKQKQGAVVLVIINNSPATTPGIVYNTTVIGVATMVPRYEYHLTAPALNSTVMLLNGKPLLLDPQTGELPPLVPLSVTAANSSIVMLPLEVAFIEFPNAMVEPCM